MRLLRAGKIVAGGFLSGRLGAPGPRLRRLLATLWLACFAGVLIVQSVTIWRGYVFDAKTQPVFASLGLVTVRADSRNWFVKPIETAKPMKKLNAAASSRPKAKAPYSPKPFKGRVVAVNGEPVAGFSAEALADKIASSGGRPVDITLAHIGKKKHKAPETVSIIPSAEKRDRVLAQEDQNFKIATQIIDLLLAALLLAAAFAVRKVHFDRSINIAFSFVMLFAGTVGSSRFWQFVGADQGLYYCYLVWMALLLMIVPAWPDGEFRPRWTRWSLVVGPAIAIAIFWNRKAVEQSSVLTALSLVAITTPIVAAAIQRYRLEIDRRQRQQLKWVFIGFGFGLLFVLAGLLVPEHGGWLPSSISSSARYGTFMLRRLGVLLIIVGLTLSLMRFRLNDTDAVIGRSVGYAALMTGLAVLWSIGENFTNNAVTSLAGSSNSTLAVSITTIVTVAVIAPARERMLDWTRRRFQGGLMRLHELPHRLVRWHANDPEQLAEKALAAIVGGVDPSSAALVWVDSDGGSKILALHNTKAEDAMCRLTATSIGAEFPLRYLFTSPSAGSALILMLGRRGDGASYTRQERVALEALLDPLAEVEQSAFLRWDREMALTARVGQLHARMQQLHEKAAKRGRKNRQTLTPVAAG